MTPQEFIAKWGPGGPAFDLNERQGAQPHFMDLCQLLCVPTPGSTGDYIFEQDTLVPGELDQSEKQTLLRHLWTNPESFRPQKPCRETDHQRTETLPDGSVIPGNWGQSANSPETMPASGQAKLDSDPKFPSAAYMPNVPLAPVNQAQAAIKNKARSAMRTEVDPPSLASRYQAIVIAQAAKRLNDLRENWLNPPEWTHKVPEVIPLGLDKSPYPDRIEPKPGISEADLKALQKRTLTNLYNAKPAWLAMAHEQLDKAVAAAYGWADYRADMPDDEILKRLLALNLVRSANVSGNN
jgi:hypothetical protein